MKIDVPAGILAWFDFEFPDVGQNAAPKIDKLEPKQTKFIQIHQKNLWHQRGHGW